MKIKFCGITNKEDALNAIALNVDAIGFIFYESSPRYISVEAVEEIVLDFPPFIQVVGVFVNESHETITNISNRCRLTSIQLHGNEPPEFCIKFHLPTIKAIQVKDVNDISVIPKYKGCVNGILLDTKVHDVHGGSGKTFDWGVALEAKQYDVPLLLSGGINIGNIAKAIKMVAPYGVDICTGVEKEPGIKDYHKMQALIDAINKL